MQPQHHGHQLARHVWPLRNLQHAWCICIAAAECHVELEHGLCLWVVQPKQYEQSRIGKLGSTTVTSLPAMSGRFATCSTHGVYVPQQQSVIVCWSMVHVCRLYNQSSLGNRQAGQNHSLQLARHVWSLRNLHDVMQRA
jgi:hypothetical protein